jgi:hypothetical protein
MTIINLFTELCITEEDIIDLINFYKLDMVVSQINNHYVTIKSPEVMDPAECTEWVSVKALDVAGYLSGLCSMKRAA